MNELFKWELPSKPSNAPPVNGEVAIVDIPVKVLFQWSDKIIIDHDEETGEIEYGEGFVMTVLPDQKFVYDDHPRKTFAFHNTEKS